MRAAVERQLARQATVEALPGPPTGVLSDSQTGSSFPEPEAAPSFPVASDDWLRPVGPIAVLAGIKNELLSRAGIIHH